MADDDLGLETVEYSSADDTAVDSAVEREKRKSVNAAVDVVATESEIADITRGIDTSQRTEPTPDVELDIPKAGWISPEQASASSKLAQMERDTARLAKEAEASRTIAGLEKATAQAEIQMATQQKEATEAKWAAGKAKFEAKPVVMAGRSVASAIGGFVGGIGEWQKKRKEAEYKQKVQGGVLAKQRLETENLRRAAEFKTAQRQSTQALRQHRDVMSTIQAQKATAQIEKTHADILAKQQAMELKMQQAQPGQQEGGLFSSGGQGSGFGLGGGSAGGSFYVAPPPPKAQPPTAQPHGQAPAQPPAQMMPQEDPWSKLGSRREESFTSQKQGDPFAHLTHSGSGGLSSLMGDKGEGGLAALSRKPDAGLNARAESEGRGSRGIGAFMGGSKPHQEQRQSGSGMDAFINKREGGLGGLGGSKPQDSGFAPRKESGGLFGGGSKLENSFGGGWKKLMRR